MANRSLFSPFASSVNPYAVRNIVNLFSGPDNIEINPDYLALLQSGVEPPPEMLMTTPLYKGGRSAKLANAKFLGDLVQGQFSRNLATSAEKELIPFRSKAEVEQAKEIAEFSRKQKKEVEEEELGDLGQSIGQVLGSLPTEQFNNIIPPGTAFRSPQEQARFYSARVGGNVPIQKALVETSPEVTQSRILEEANKRRISMGSGVSYDPVSGEFIYAGGYEPIQEQTTFDTGELTPILDPNTGLPSGKFTTKKALKTITKQQFIPPRRQKFATQPALDNIPKESGAETDETLSTVGVDRPQITGNFLGPLNVPGTPKQLPLNTELKQSVQPSFGEKFWGYMRDFNAVRGLPSLAELQLKKKEEPKERPKAYPLDHLIEAYKLNKNQKEDFEFFVQNYTKNEGKHPSLEEARAYIQVLIKKK